jgi:tetratricopeptide (TPR) repeat protein
MQAKQPKPHTSQNRWSQLTAIGMFVAVAIIGLVVFLTPHKEEPVDPDQESKKPHTSSVNVPKRFQLPTQVDAVSSEVLQEMLATIAESLPTRFPSDPAAYHASAMIFAELRQTQKAKEMWETCLEMGTLEVGPAVGLAGILVEQGDETRALALLEKVQKASKGSTAEFYQQLSDLYSRTGELELAEQTARQGLTPFSQSAPLWLQLGLVQSQQRKFDKAEASLRRAISLGDSSSTTRNALVTVLNRTGKSDEAKAIMASASSVAAPSGPSLEKDANDDAGFQDQYRQALRELSVPLLRNASAVAFAHGRLDLAEEWLLKAMAEEPSNPALYMDLSSILRSAKRLEDALLVHQRLVEVQPMNPLNDMNLASVATQINRIDMAERTLLNAVEKFPKVAFLYGELAKLSLGRGQFLTMNQFAKQAYELEPQNIEWTLMLAMSSKQLKDEAAFRSYRKLAQELAPNDPRVLDLLSQQAE